METDKLVEIPTTSYGETLLKEILDFVFENECYEDNIKPEWLQRLELDRYYPNLRLALEYQGSQHYYFVPCFHKCLRDLKEQKTRDRTKERLCRKQGVTLVIIGHLDLSVGQVCQRILTAAEKKRNLYHQHLLIEQIVQPKMPKLVGGEYRKELNKKCAKYKNLTRSNYKSGKWVRHPISYARKHHPREMQKKRQYWYYSKSSK